jgi:1-acyl-sn-glycerol-3-phosphate acyltransferase
MRALHFAAGKVIRAATIFEKGAKQEIDDGLSQGRQIFLAHNHQSFYDPFVLASMIQREKAFHPMRTRTAIPGKSSEFNKPYSWVVRNSGAIPVFRKQEHGSDSDDPEEKAAREAARKKANDSQVIIMQSKMNKGFHGAIYPEGTRGKDDGSRRPTELLPIQSGIGRIACELDNPENVDIVCVGTLYVEDNDDMRHPLSVVTPPFAVGSSVEEVVAQTGETLQHAVDSAALYAGYNFSK